MNVKRIIVKTLTLGLLAGSLALSQASAADEFDVRPVPVKTPPPAYPSAMQREGVDGLVAVKVVIDEKGAVAECVVTKSSRSEFEQPALAAIKNWKFKPATKEGTPVKCTIIIPLKFALES